MAAGRINSTRRCSLTVYLNNSVYLGLIKIVVSTSTVKLVFAVAYIFRLPLNSRLVLRLIQLGFWNAITLGVTSFPVPMTNGTQRPVGVKPWP